MSHLDYLTSYTDKQVRARVRQFERFIEKQPRLIINETTIVERQDDDGEPDTWPIVADFTKNDDVSLEFVHLFKQAVGSDPTLRDVDELRARNKVVMPHRIAWPQ